MQPVSTEPIYFIWEKYVNNIWTISQKLNINTHQHFVIIKFNCVGRLPHSIDLCCSCCWSRFRENTYSEKHRRRYSWEIHPEWMFLPPSRSLQAQGPPRSGYNDTLGVPCSKVGIPVGPLWGLCNKHAPRGRRRYPSRKSRADADGRRLTIVVSLANWSGTTTNNDRGRKMKDETRFQTTQASFVWP